LNPLKLTLLGLTLRLLKLPFRLKLLARSSSIDLPG